MKTKALHITIGGLEIIPIKNGSILKINRNKRAWQRRQWHPTPVLFPGKSHGRRSLVGCSPWGCWELDTTQWLRFHFSLSCIGEGGGGPLPGSCLENPRDGGGWWAAICGVAQGWKRLKRHSSSSSSSSNLDSSLCFFQPSISHYVLCI